MLRTVRHLIQSPRKPERFIVSAIGQEQTQLQIQKIGLRDRLELGMMYDPGVLLTSSRPFERWKFTFIVDEAAYVLEYAEGIELIRRLDGFAKVLRGE